MREGKSRRHWVRSALLGIVIAVIAIAVIGVIGKGRTRTAAIAYQFAEDAQTQAAPFVVASLSSPDELETALDTLIKAESVHHRSDDDEATPQNWPDAVRVCAAYLRACSTADPKEYEAWAKLQGKSLAPAMPEWGAYTEAFYAGRYKEVVGRTMPTPIAPQQYFDDYFPAYWSRAGKEMRPASVAIDALAFEVQTQTFKHWGDHITAEPHDGGLGDAFWNGGIGISSMMFWWPERVIATNPDFLTGAASPSRATILDIQRALFDPYISQYGSLDAVRVMMVYRSAKGINVPVLFILIRRPDDGIWELIGMGISNVGADVGVGSILIQPPIH